MAMTAIAELFHDLIIVDRRVRARPVPGVAGDGHRHPDDAGVLPLRRRRGLRQGARERARCSRPARWATATLVNLSMNQTLARSFATTFTALLPGGEPPVRGRPTARRRLLEDLALALIVGIASGAYSSMFFASPILAKWKEREPRYRGRRRQRDTSRAERAARSQRSPGRVDADAGARRAATAPTAAVGGSAAEAAPRARPKKPSRPHGRPTPVVAEAPPHAERGIAVDLRDFVRDVPDFPERRASSSRTSRRCSATPQRSRPRRRARRRAPPRSTSSAASTPAASSSAVRSPIALGARLRPVPQGRQAALGGRAGGLLARVRRGAPRDAP